MKRSSSLFFDPRLPLTLNSQLSNYQLPLIKTPTTAPRSFGLSPSHNRTIHLSALALATAARHPVARGFWCREISSDGFGHGRLQTKNLPPHCGRKREGLSIGPNTLY